MAGLALGIGALVINTVGHLTVKETPVDKDATIPVKVIARFLYFKGGSISKTGVRQKICSAAKKAEPGCILVRSRQR